MAVELRDGQRNVVNLFSTTYDHLIVNATAGAGKTFLLQQLHAVKKQAMLQSGVKDPSVLLMAYNVKIVKAIQEKMGGSLGNNDDVRTVHSYGFSGLRSLKVKRWNVDSWKYTNLIKAWAFMYGGNDWQWENEVTPKIRKTVSFLRSALCDMANVGEVLEVVKDYELDDVYDHALLPLYRALVHVGDFLAKNSQHGRVSFPMTGDRAIDAHVTLIENAQYEVTGNGRWERDVLRIKTNWIDYDDQLILPITWNLPLQQFDLVFVDECQDQNKVRQVLVQRAVAPGGKVVMVGDKDQAINGWCGADSRSMSNLQDMFGAKWCGLNESFRCPKSHTAYVRNSIGYDIQSAPWLEEGVIESLDDPGFESFLRKAHAGNEEVLILCRTNAPLLKLGMWLLSQRMPALINGREEFGKGLVTFIKKLAKGKTFAQVPETVHDWKVNEHLKLESKGAGDSAHESIDDKADCVMALWESSYADTIEAWTDDITALFDDRVNSPILLSSVHRAKGLESENVVVLQPGKMPMFWGKEEPSEEKIRQEMNVMFVAFTRSLHTMIFHESERWETEKNF